jgi:hypothetical protein
MLLIAKNLYIMAKCIFSAYKNHLTIRNEASSQPTSGLSCNAAEEHQEATLPSCGKRDVSKISLEIVIPVSVQFKRSFLFCSRRMSYDRDTQNIHPHDPQILVQNDSYKRIISNAVEPPVL